MKTLKGFIDWVGKLFSTSGDVSSKRFNAIVVVVAAVCWLSFDLHNHGITNTWVVCYQTLVCAVVLGYVGGVALGEKKKEVDKDGEPQ